jgi:GDP-L-fucose synthase
LRFDASKPDGTPRKLLDVAKLTQLGWTATTPLEDGLKLSYRWFLEHQQEARGVGRQATRA